MDWFDGSTLHSSVPEGVSVARGLDGEAMQSCLIEHQCYQSLIAHAPLMSFERQMEAESRQRCIFSTLHPSKFHSSRQGRNTSQALVDFMNAIFSNILLIASNTPCTCGRSLADAGRSPSITSCRRESGSDQHASRYGLTTHKPNIELGCESS